MTTLGCTGHQAIPPDALPYVVDAIDRIIHTHASDALVGVCSLATGADQLFAQALLDAGGQLRVIIPCEGYESTFDEDGLRRYTDLLDHASVVQRLTFDEPSEEAFLVAGERVAKACDLLVAVWDGAPAQGRGGTADVVAHAAALGRPVEVIWPEGILRA